MTNMYNRLFKSTLAETAEQPSGGLVSPYSVPRKDITALAIDELNNDIGSIGSVVSRTHRNCSSSIGITKNTDLSGFLDFRSRIIDAMNLNNILPDDSYIRDQLADIFTWSYSAISKNSTLLVYDTDHDAKTAAMSIMGHSMKAGLVFKEKKIKDLFFDVLVTVCKKLPRESSNGSK